MRRQKISPYVYLLLALFFTLSLSHAFVERVRFLAVACVSPSWHLCEEVKKGTLLFTSMQGSRKAGSEQLAHEMEKLKRENRVLSEQIEHVRQWVVSEERVEAQMVRVKALDAAAKEGAWKGYFRRRKEELASILKLQLKAIPAKVVFRDPSLWSSFIWLNVGEKQNRALQEKVIAKNSPVVVGNILVGLVEEVGERQCKVRLLTDANLQPAVRSVRGGRQDQFFLEQMEALLQLLQIRKDLFTSAEEERLLIDSLHRMMGRLEASEATSYLAKGSLKGSSLPLWRTRGQFLKGMGFNYDFSDGEGSARDIRTGLALLKEGDLLVTTGLDGIFPAGLEVAVVSKVHRLKEGASSYEIEAKALAENFGELSSLSILPPVSGI